MSDRFVQPASSLQGEVEVPGDKSLSHRALLLALVSDEPVRITNLARSGDVDSTLRAIQKLGATVEIDEQDPSSVIVRGVGLRGIVADKTVTIDCGNAGTLARLLPGLLVGQTGRFRLVGDESLSRRPMGRIVEPLKAMGADIKSSAGGTLPITITGGAPIRAVECELQIASAQVQSCIVFAGLFADGSTVVNEPDVLRDHTERMLRSAGVRVDRSGRAVTVHPATSLQLPSIQIAADPSAAAPFVLAATLLAGSMLRLPGVLANPTRTGFIEQLERMGARIGTMSRENVGGEATASYEVGHAQLTRSPLHRSDIPRMIDEIPLYALAGHFCRGETRVRGAGELRHKESDRITSTVNALRVIGCNVEERGAGITIRGSGTRPPGGTIHAEGDHRIAMLGGIAGLVSRTGVTVVGAECVDISYPGFFDVLDALAVRSTI